MTFYQHSQTHFSARTNKYWYGNCRDFPYQRLIICRHSISLTTVTGPTISKAFQNHNGVILKSLGFSFLFYFYVNTQQYCCTRYACFCLPIMCVALVKRYCSKYYLPSLMLTSFPTKFFLQIQSCWMGFGTLGFGFGHVVTLLKCSFHRNGNCAKLNSQQKQNSFHLVSQNIITTI